MTSANLHVEVDGLNIIITMPLTSFRMAYRKSQGDPWLIASDYVRDDRDAPITRADFLAQAWRAADPPLGEFAQQARPNGMTGLLLPNSRPLNCVRRDSLDL